MRGYLSHIRMTFRLALRDRFVIFFNYALPLMFFFLFGQMFRADEGGITQVVSMVLTIGVLGSGLMGAGIRAAADREQNILRRFKVAPITPAPILVASLVNGLLLFIPQIAIVLFLSRTVYKMPPLEHPLSLYAFLGLGVLAFRAIGGMVAAVVNSMQESQVIIQLLYLPMLLLGGTVPVGLMPAWVQTLAQFVPSSHLATGMQAILLGHGGVSDNLQAVGALGLTAVLGTFLGIKLFRWEKEEKLPASAKLWLLAVFSPFLAIGAWQAHAKDNVARQKVLAHELRRHASILIHDARLLIGDGRIIERGSVLVRDGKIARIFEGESPEPKTLNAAAIEGAGKTLLPGLIDVHVHLGANGGISTVDYARADARFNRELPQYLFSGVTAVKSAGDSLDTMLKLRSVVNSGEALGAEFFLVGPMFTAEGGHGTEVLQYLPQGLRVSLEQQTVRAPKSADEARKQVMELKAKGVDGIKAILESGASAQRFNRLDPEIFKAVAAAAHEASLPLVVHTGDSLDVALALEAGASGIEHGSFRDAIPDALFVKMKQQGVTYDPTLAVMESLMHLAQASPASVSGSLVQQSAPPELLASITGALAARRPDPARAEQLNRMLDQGKKNLLAAYRAGVTLVTGTDSGNPLTLHGPAVHREIQLWVEAGVPSAVALQAATHNAATLLGAGDRIGLIHEGYDATLLLVDGNPLEDIRSTERISAILLKGERVNRQGLFE